jgi:S1-C subfamily serine protease
MVLDVQNGSAAARTGLQPGDVITGINNMKTGSLAEFKQVLRKLQGRKASIAILRQGMAMTMTIIR